MSFLHNLEMEINEVQQKYKEHKKEIKFYL